MTAIELSPRTRFIGCDLAYSYGRQHVIRAIVNEFPAPAGKAASAGTNADKYPSETGRQNMSDESKKLQADFASGTALTPARNQNIVDLDGFNDFTNEVEGAEDERVNTSARVIQGTKLKYIDPRWQIDGRDVTGMLLTLVGTRNVVNKWGPDGKPLVTNILPPGEKFPDFKKLNAEEPQSAWRMVFGKLQGPWQGQHCLYFIDDNYNPFTWPSPITTIGSSIAVEEIVDHIKRVRRYRDPDACVLVELSRKHFPNKYKPDRERPFLQVKQLVKLAPGRMSQLPEADEPLPALSQRGALADAQTVEPITLAEEMNDTIKY